MSNDRDYNNYKPYRTKEQKVRARSAAAKRGDGAFRSHTPVSFHDVRKDLLKGDPDNRPPLFVGPSKGKPGESVVVRDGRGRPVERLTKISKTMFERERL